MKTVRFIPVLILFAFLLTSCREAYGDTYGIGKRISSELGEGTEVYYSLSSEEDDGYMNEELVGALFGGSLELPENFTVILSKRHDVILEIGIFLTTSRNMSIDLRDLLLLRIYRLEALTDAKGEVFIEGNLVIYYFTDLTVDVKSVILSSL